ncbi:3-isopropylmalate dehydratase small subunit [Mesorhizobium sp. M7A.F.Ca.CA.001.09.2.1]|uniref:3-isopropylmalate dehydratase small subunit n=2 Tax=Mesorhizobium TaxID=68287 RepID=A0AB38TK50_9HYPH|nr:MULTISPECIES: 3-isopropylmalate dehydratase small subunit [Mesorhizobium]RUU10420.1 3-isopropylmalate dehydratase small subunit [Mesorhizobium sp. M7A.T.Ca.TU.009.01.3.2]RUV47872.1 3-isopropylmalate dehydratase small subunit [Mesorhizobium sp. M7A.F.Ca.MR.228.00.0.0]RUY59221.1 3-isopropylmalate dehydratase small subunit [Mesorhizobium sp. M7A.F.Ca.CA.001.13.2.1]RWN92274.1 MAG: 3-isopropylmalate dehydratase small subunit [Mesorhizobium sp.]MDF3156070.1 3-isopropylmalate dehydratase small sub
MEPFKSVTATAVPFPGVNVDTDQILPARFLSKPRAEGFAQYLFHDLRFDDGGKERENFVLNTPPYRHGEILVGEDNFGCGSSRENAVWAVADYGFRVVVAPSFGDIFFSNSLKNGLLPVVLKRDAISSIMIQLKEQQGATIEVDLAAQTLTAPNGAVHSFEIDEFSKHCLLNGIDELDYTLSQKDQIDAFEKRHAAEQGWTVPD